MIGARITIGARCEPSPVARYSAVGAPNTASDLGLERRELRIGRLILRSLRGNAIVQGAEVRQPFDKLGITPAPMKREDFGDSRKSRSPPARRSSSLPILSHSDGRSITMEGR